MPAADFDARLAAAFERNGGRGRERRSPTPAPRPDWAWVWSRGLVLLLPMAVLFGAMCVMPDPVGSVFRQVAQGNSPFRGAPVPFGVTHTLMLARCDARVPQPPPLTSAFLVGLSRREARALRIAAEACRRGEPLPDEVLRLAQHASALITAATPPKPSVGDAARLLGR